MNVIDNPNDLLNLSDAELMELLCDEKYNKENLKQLLIRCMSAMRAIKTINNYCFDGLERYTDKYNDLLENIQKICNKG